MPALVLYGFWVLTGSTWGYLFVPAVALTLFVGYFFRDPPRTPAESTEDVWLSPADGIVSEVGPDPDGRTRIVIFLTVFNVHVNRMPVDGSLVDSEHHEGEFRPAFDDDILDRNERTRHLCEDPEGRRFEVWQVAGMLARRIHVWIQPGDRYERGDRFGMISFGSRTDLVLPDDVEARIEEGDLVRGGRTVVARTR